MNDESRSAEYRPDESPSARPEPMTGSSHDRSSNGTPEDRLLADSVREKLASTGYHQLLRIDVAAEGSNIRLSGRVGRYYLLQVAQQAAMEAEGIAELQNDLQVVSTSSGR